VCESRMKKENLLPYPYLGESLEFKIQGGGWLQAARGSASGTGWRTGLGRSVGARVTDQC